MYKYESGQMSITDFGQPMGMHLNENNRWVKKAALIPWDEIEKRYAGLFKSKTGNPAKPLRLALGACMIQAEYGFSDEEVALQIQENAYLQYFCGYDAYDDRKPPFDPSSMVYFRKRLTPEILGEINEMILSENKENSPSDDEDHSDGANSGTMIVDATCAPSKIKYPQDASLLNQARESTERLIDSLHTPGEMKPRTYRKKAHKDYLALTRCRKPTAKKIRKAIGKQLSYLGRNLASIENQMMSGKKLTSAEQNRLSVIQKIYLQQKYMYDNKIHSVPDRIVSLSQPWVRPIVRGKAGKPVEFGAKLDISVVNGFTRLEYLSFDAYNEATTLQQTIEHYRERTGHYPARVLADKIYRNRDNLTFCKEHNIRLSGPALGRPKKDEQPDRKQNYTDECERVEVERRFSLAKRKCNLGLVTAKLMDTAYHCIAMSIVVLNLRKLMLSLYAIIKFWLGWINIKKVLLVQ
jgi:transposase, IS5 family